jgi:hypothetical protein
VCKSFVRHHGVPDATVSLRNVGLKRASQTGGKMIGSYVQCITNSTDNTFHERLNAPVLNGSD